MNHTKKKRCLYCGKHMQRYGYTAKGTPRWRCVTCEKTNIRTRADTRRRHIRTHFIRWITGVVSLIEIAQKFKISRQQLTKRFVPLWHETPPQPPPYHTSDHCLIVDGVYLSGRTNAVFIARTQICVRAWYFCDHECFSAWDEFFARIPPPDVIVIDGQKGLQSAVLQRFPDAKIQRCMVHVERFVRMCISMRPKTEAGKELWISVRSLWEVRTPVHADAWNKEFMYWQTRYDVFLKEKSYSSETGRWWYTHRKLRAARSHIRNALPYLFTFTEVPNVPRTTNHVEGGVNARLKELIRRHRGFSPRRKRILVSYFLAAKTKEKPTRKFT